MADPGKRLNPGHVDIASAVMRPWTPVDVSTDALTMAAGTVGRYIQVGKLIFAWGTLVYPVTAGAGNSAIGGMPASAAMPELGVVVGGAPSGGGFVSRHIGGPGTFAMDIDVAAGQAAVAQFTKAGTNTRTTNAEMSGSTVRFLLIYPVTVEN